MVGPQTLSGFLEGFPTPLPHMSCSAYPPLKKRRAVLAIFALTCMRSTYLGNVGPGSVVCENIPSGDYAITKATDEDLPEMVIHASKLAGIKVASEF